MTDSDIAAPNASSEVEVLSVIVQALKKLPSSEHRRVIDAALVLLGSTPSNAGRSSLLSQSGDAPGTFKISETATDIRQLTEQKHPQSANEMAALVAYYLAEIAGPTEKKEVVEFSDIQKYFKQAGFRLPQKPAMTLVNAKNSGYLDLMGGGRYKLNPVGYNLVVHALPRTKQSKTTKVRKRSSKPVSRRTR
jgi:hypothetical protein